MNNYEQQLELYFNDCHNSLTFIIGEKGLGKSYFIHNFFKENSNVLYIKDQIFKSYFLDPIIQAITKFDNNISITRDNLNMPDIVRKKLLNICKHDNIVICFENFNSYPEDLAEFCMSFFQAFLDNCYNYNAFILIELDSDITEQNEDLTKKLYSLTMNTNFIKFEKRTEDELFEIISNSFNKKICINEKERKYIVKSSFGNISYLFIIINYLKQEGYIYFDGLKWFCKNLPNGILNQSVEDYIKKRYNRLNNDLKCILQKSSLLGVEFDAIQLQRTFNLVKAEEELTRIEKISSLIKKNESNDNRKCYLFETDEVCDNIQNLIPSDEKKIWNKMLAEYYEIQYNKLEQNFIKRLENCCRLATYYKNCDEKEKSVVFCFRAIRYSIYFGDFHHALEFMDIIKEFCYTSKEYKSIYSEILNLEAYCYHQLGKYEIAAKFYSELLVDKTFFQMEKMEILYLYADTLYFIGKVSNALKILLSLKKQLEITHNDKLLFKVLSKLATVYGFFREYGSAREYFSYSVNQCHSAGLDYDYYVQLRKSSMFWELQLTNPLMQQAADFFQKKNHIQELARTYHNLGTDSLYLGNSKPAIQYLKQASEEFKKYGSDEIHYTYNCIGVYYAAYEQDFEKAIQYFQKAVSFDPVLFSTMVLYINIASCFKALNNNEMSKLYLEKAIKKQETLGEEIPSYSLYLLINQGLFARIDGKLEESKQHFTKSLEYKLNTNQLYLVGKNLSDISTDVDENISKYSSLDAEPLYQNYYKNNICLSTLRFWE